MSDPGTSNHARGRALLRGLRRARNWAGRLNRTDSVVQAARSARKVAPGELPILEVSSNPTRNSDRIARLIGEAGSEQPSAIRELGLTAVQLWQALVTRRPAVEAPSEYVTILFTDLVGFSTWALRAGDDKVLTLLRQVNAATTEVVTRRDGRVVKSLGDGVMAVFVDGADAIEAAHEAGLAVSAITIDGYRPQLRAGLHTGKPRRDGDDYLGIDVNIAARVADAASGGEVLATSSTFDVTDEDKYIKRRRRFRAKGAPKDLIVYAVVPRYDATI